MITGELKSKVDKIWNAFWTGGVSNPLTVIEQFTYLLFIRRIDEEQSRMEKKALRLGEPMERSYFTEDEQPLRWSQIRHVTQPDEMFSRFTVGVTMLVPEVNKKTGETEMKERAVTVFDHMKNLNSNEAGVFARYMKGATFMIPTARLLDQLIQMIGNLDMKDRDTKGDLYEYLLSKLSQSGTNGQFRTPRHIISMMVEMMQPGPEDLICDPSCGTAGFLVEAGEYLRRTQPELFHKPVFMEHFKGDMFTGIEFDPSMLRISAMNLQLHGIESPNLVDRDALSEANSGERDRYTLMLANPPFKGSLDYDHVEPSLLATVKTKKTELLFLALMLRMLNTGGRCAVIVPDGVLFGSSKAHKQLRETLVEQQRLQAVVKMPGGVFKPYAGVSTAVLIFTKTDRGDTGQVWFYDMQADGYSLDDKRSAIKENDIPDVIARYRNPEQEATRKRTEQSFMVPKAEIVGNDYDLSINRYKEVVYEEVAYAPPAEIIADIKELDQQRADALKVLEELLG